MNVPAEESLAWVLDPRLVQEELTLIGLREDLIPPLIDGARRAARDSRSPALLGKIHAAGLRGERGPFEIPDHPWLPALAVIAGFPHARSLYRRRGVPHSLVFTTLRDIERSIDAYHREYGRFGFQNVRWMRHHLRARLVEIGRLQFQPAELALPYHIFRKTSDASTVVFARQGLTCTAEGWLDSSADHFPTGYSVDEKTVRGHRVLPESGAIAPTVSEVVVQDHERVADATTPFLFVHIPSGGKLSMAECDASLEQAAAQLPGFFPEWDFRGFACVSWLLDRELTHCLPPDSNMLHFGRRFFPLAFPNATGDQLLERVFGPGMDPNTAVPTNAFQRAVLQRLRAGGTFRMTGGVILKPEWGKGSLSPMRR